MNDERRELGYIEKMIKLDKFNKDYFKNLDEHEEILFVKNGVYYTILVNNEKVGIVGYVPAYTPDSGFLQIVISRNHRGKGIAGYAINMLIKKHYLKTSYAVIKSDNLSSINAFRKIGFKLKDDEIRLVRNNHD